MLPPESLYEIVGEPPADEGIVLLHALDGFLDAGSAGKAAADALLGGLESRPVVEFDLDQLYDYRARRPPLIFAEDHYEGYEPPTLRIQSLTDQAGVPFLLLSGPEPDIGWERFAAAVVGLVTRFRVGRVIGLGGVPMTVPHTRPVMLTRHATKPGAVSQPNVWRGKIRVPASMAAILELRLGEAGRDAEGVVAHVPHYLAATEYPEAAAALLEAVISATGLVLPIAGLHEAAAGYRRAVEAQLANDPQAPAVVEALEQQYDATLRVAGQTPGDEADLPSGEEIGAELERFLAGLDRREENP